MERSIVIETKAEWPVATKSGLAILILAALIGIMAIWLSVASGSGSGSSVASEGIIRNSGGTENGLPDWVGSQRQPPQRAELENALGYLPPAARGYYPSNV